MRFTILGCGSSPGVPRIGGDWGACDPANPKNRRRRCSLLAERIVGVRPARSVLDRHQPGPARAGARRRHRHARRRALHARRMPTTSTASTICAASSSTCAGASTSMPTRDDGAADARRSATASRRRPDSDYPPILNAHPIEAGEPRDDRGAGRCPRRSADQPGRTAASPRSAFRIGGLAYSPDLSDLDDEARAPAAGPRRVDRRRAAADAASEPSSLSTRRSAGSSA